MSLQVLLATYTDLRASARHPATISVTLYSLLWLIFAGLAQGVASVCNWRQGTCGEVPEWVIAMAGFLPVAVMSFLLMLVSNDRLRDYYLFALETEITSKYKASAPFRNELRLYMPSFHIVRSPSWVAETPIADSDTQMRSLASRSQRWLLKVWKSVPSILWAFVYAALVTGQALVNVAVIRLTDDLWFLVPLVPSLLLLAIGCERLAMGKRYARRLLCAAPPKVRAGPSPRDIWPGGRPDEGGQTGHKVIPGGRTGIPTSSA